MARPPRLPQTGPSIFDDDWTPEPAAEAHPPTGPADGLRQVRRPPRHLIVEADGGSRGNPGPAAYGALVRDGGTGDVLDAEGLAIGEATNNVAEYSGLIAGLEMARRIDPEASVEVRMDSRLVVEQMAGRWRVKHPAMKPLALRAQSLRPREVSWTWVPREANKAADALVNQALDGQQRQRAH